jgi:hypothetical protein
MPSDFAPCMQFGSNLYWIRAVDINVNLIAHCRAEYPHYQGIYLNTAWASQSETFEDETFSSLGTHSQEFTLDEKIRYIP